MSTERKKLEITLPANVDAETLEAVINGIGVKLVVTSDDPKLNGKPIVISRAEVIEENPAFPMMIQTALTNAATKTRATKTNTIAHKGVDLDGAFTKYSIKNGDFTINLPKTILPKDLNNNTSKLLDVVFRKLNQIGINNRAFVISKEEFKKLRGIKTEKAWRKKLPSLRRDILLLGGSNAEWNAKGKKGKQSFGTMSLFDIFLYENKEIKVAFAPTFFTHLLKYGTPMPHNADASNALNDQKNPYSYHLLKKLEEHKYMNSGKSNEDIISTRALRSAIPMFPTLESVTDRHITARIIEPFARDMDVLEELGVFSWEFCHKNGIPLTNEELGRDEETGETIDDKPNVFNCYEIFDKMLVKITWKNYPSKSINRKNVKKRTAKHKRISEKKNTDQ